jgi:hypothetical protein
MVGAGNLIKLLFGLPYEAAIVIVGVVMMAYVLFGGMIATTWVQIVKAVLLLGGALLLSVLVLVRVGGGPLALFATAARRFGAQVLGPGQLVADPLEQTGLKLTDVDKYAAELQNPEITEPAGAGDVPKANFKMIAAMAVKKGELERTAIEGFTVEHGMPGFAPTQGHIPSGVPYVGPARDAILSGKLNRAMIIGKGSLFLGRMTNLFDGVSFVIEKNPGKQAEAGSVGREEVRKLIAEGLKELADKWLS